MTGSSVSPSPTVLRYLGGGGMADVYLARLPNGELAALKRLRPQLAAEMNVLQQLEREARIGALLAHENIVGFKGVGRDSQGPYLVLEYVEGMSSASLLRAWVAQHRAHLPIATALSILADVADGLSYAHALKAEGVEGVIHRDISPDNVLIALNGCAKLSDFGIAKMLGATKNTRTGALRGKFGYLAPELFDNSGASAASDVFSLGATAFRLLSSVSPFQGESEAQLVRAVLHAQPAKLLSLRAEVPPEIAAWVDQSLSKNSSDRPSLADLSKLLRGIRDPGRTMLSEYVRALYESQAPEPTSVPKRRTVALSAPRRRASIGVIATLTVAFAATAALWASRFFPAAPPQVIATTPAKAPSVPHEPRSDSEPSAPPSQVALSVPPPEATPKVAPNFPSRSSGKSRTVRRVGSTVDKKPPSIAIPTTGTLRIKVRPWGEVFVDGTLRGVAPPLAPLELPRGMHSVIVINQETKQKRSYQVEVVAGQETELKAILDDAPAP